VRLALAAMMAVLAIGAAAIVPADRKYYVGKSLAACETIDYACPSGWKAFQDEQGCGCFLPPPEEKREDDRGKPDPVRRADPGGTAR
jgi:hypothetical protein